MNSHVTKALGPLFTDFTWGAGGSTSELTLKLTSAAKNEFGCVANMHLTCTNQSSEMTGNALKDCRQLGVRNIVALRGDPPRGQEKWTATEGGFSSALDLVKFIRKNHGDYFSISVACYPEGHPDNIEVVEGGVEALTASEKRRARVVKDEQGKEVVSVCRDANFHKEMVYLKEKVDAGAAFVITQMFLDAQAWKFETLLTGVVEAFVFDDIATFMPTEQIMQSDAVGFFLVLHGALQVFLDFVEECRKYDIKVPIVPGIMCCLVEGMCLYSAYFSSCFVEGFVSEPSQIHLSSLRSQWFGWPQAHDRALQNTIA